jgi:hypothetical protein
VAPRRDAGDARIQLTGAAAAVIVGASIKVALRSQPMIPNDLADQVRDEVKRFMEVRDLFLQTYKRLCAHCGGPEWQKDEAEVLFHQVRMEVIPLMEQVGADPTVVQALCSWAERPLLNQFHSQRIARLSSH